MAFRSRRLMSSFVFAALILVSASGCTKTFHVRAVGPTQSVYGPAARAEPTAFAIADVRSPAAKPLNVGTLNVELRGMSDEIAYLADNLVRVFRAQGITVTYDPTKRADVTLEVKTFRIRNLRTSGYSPYHSFTTFAADLRFGGGTSLVTAYFKGSKTPVWAFSEVERPCYQIPVEAIVKEIAAKMNERVFGRVTPTETVLAMAAAISTKPSDSASEEYLKVLELGYTNNPAAIDSLVRLTEREETLMRAAAVSSLGTLRATEQLPLLRTIYAENTHVVKAMALKSIGDLDTAEARAFLDGVRQSRDYKEPTLKEVIDLYY